MLFILFSSRSFATISLVKAIIKLVELIMWPGKSYGDLYEERERREGTVLQLLRTISSLRFCGSDSSAMGWCWAPSSLFDVWVPDSDPLLWKKAPTRRHGTERPHLPVHLQVGMYTYICVPSLFMKRKNKTFKKCLAMQDKISLISAFHLTVPRWSLFSFFSSISFLP